MFNDFICNFMLGLLMAVIAVIIGDWGRIWWHARRHGVILVPSSLYKDRQPTRWEASYLGYKVWTWVVLVSTWLLALWHLLLAYSWFVDMAFAMTTS